MPDRGAPGAAPAALPTPLVATLPGGSIPGDGVDQKTVSPRSRNCWRTRATSSWLGGSVSSSS